ncbi:MAG: hypothetical protein GYB31_07355 [Bacteroidetes bacterium]|nr:hypothetical protein [Bacteroidota bacterium]
MTRNTQAPKPATLIHCTRPVPGTFIGTTRIWVFWTYIRTDVKTFCGIREMYYLEPDNE